MSGYAEYGWIDFNYSSNAQFNRQTFVGASESFNGSGDYVAGTYTVAYTDGKFHIPVFNNATRLYYGFLSGLSGGPLPIGGTVEKSISTLIMSFFGNS